LRYIHRNAISNATKYGKAGGVVETILSFDTTENKLIMKVINERGPNHTMFLAMEKEQYNDIVFSQGTTLHVDGKNSVISSGDGAWIMQKCAKTMGGKCSIEFLQSISVFTCETPSEPVSASEQISDAKEFTVPEGTIGIAIDDSKIQRKMLRKILSHLGVEGADKTLILGEEPSEIMGLKDDILAMLDKHPTSKILVLVDENLDYGIHSGSNKGASDNVTLSGSMIMHRILEDLAIDQEERILALVRSANDSTEDVAMYISRTHGFFPKAPMQKERVREIVAPLWAERFLSQTSM
jgi:hypothetical protein